MEGSLTRERTGGGMETGYVECQVPEGKRERERVKKEREVGGDFLF